MNHMRYKSHFIIRGIRRLLPACIMGVALFTATAMTGAARPNIVFINADDLDFDEISVYDYRAFPSYTGMRAAGHSLEHIPLPLLQNNAWMRHGETPHFQDPRMLTPNIAKLANEGAIFTRFYVTSAACTPSRYTTLTGRLASRNPQVLKDTPEGRQINIRWNTPILPGESSLIKELNALGYVTGMSGKWHNGSPGNIIGEWEKHAPSVYAEGIGPESDPGDLAVIRKIRSAHDALVHHLENAIGFDWAKTVSYENKERWTVPEELQVHNLEWITQGALDFLEQNHEQPFFFFVSLQVPHAHYYEGWEKDNVLATPRGFLSDIPESQPPRESIFERLEQLGIDRRSSMGTWIDDSVGAILKKLEGYGLEENTIVIFTSDHQARGKNTCYEGTRVPLIVRWPSVTKPGMRIEALAANTDFAPTLVEAAGGAPRADMRLDGKTLLPLLTGSEQSIHDFIFLEMNNSRAIVTERWKLLLNRIPPYQMVVNPQVWERGPEPIAEAMRYDQIVSERTGDPRRVGWDGIIANGNWREIGVWFYSAATFPAYFEENQLYDLKADPFEQSNLYGQPNLAADVKRLRELFNDKVASLPRPFGEFPIKAK